MSGGTTALAAREAPIPVRRPARRRVLVPWKDRQGRFSWLKAVTLAAAFLPGLVTAYWWIGGDLGARPVTEAIHATGLWAMRFLLIGLAIAPARAIFDRSRLVLVRRMLGLTALAYALAHFTLFAVDHHFHMITVASEIARRFYLLIGFATLLVLAALGATSTDGMIRRLGPAWKTLHRLVYPAAAVVMLHYFIQTKANVTEATTFAGFYLWLMGARLLPAPWRASPAGLLAVTACAALATAGVEFAWYGLATGIDPWRVLAASETLRFGLRPAHVVALAGLAITLAAALRWLDARTEMRGPVLATRV